MPQRVLITRLIPEPGTSMISAVPGVDLTKYDQDRGLDQNALIEAVRGKDAILCLLTDKMDAEVMKAAKGCKVVANMAVGYNNIDVTQATRQGIMVTNTPGVLTDATADLTWALILGIARRVADGDVEMRSGKFQGWGPLYFLGGDVTGRTLGLIGPGRIAAAVARRAKGFDMPILYTGRRDSPDLDALGAERVDLDTLLRRSDFVSLHVPLTAETKYLINAEALGKMKPSAYLINTSRGPVVDEKALVACLKAGGIAGAGLDVYEDEPRMAEGLADCANTVLLPHLGSATLGTRSAMARIAAENLVAVLEGRRPPNLVNPEVLG